MTTHDARRAVYFGPSDRPLFGVVHRPPSSWSGARILLCAPLGYEGLLAHLTLTDLALKLAEANAAVVMRFDYDGCGDSAGSDEDDERVDRMLASVDHALDYLVRLSAAPGPLFVIGLRAGALLAACVAARRSDVTGIALWAPCVTGKSFVREQRVFSQMSAANPPAPDGLARDFGPRGFDANGYVFTDGTVTALEQLSIQTLPTPPAPRILVLHRAELTTNFKVPPSWSGVEVEQRSAPGYAAMMEAPWLWSQPTEAFEVLSDWVKRASEHGDDTHAAPTLAKVRDVGKDSAEVAPGIIERPIRFGADGKRFGILTLPSKGNVSHAALLVTSTYSYRIGANRLNVSMARRLAARGIAAFRFDLKTIGDSRDEYGSVPGGPYDVAFVDDVRIALGYLKDAGYQHVALHGACASGTLAWLGAIEADEPLGLFLANVETFVPISYTREAHAQFLALEAAGSRVGLPTESARKKKARELLARASYFARWGGRALLASAPTRLRPSELPGHLVRIARRRGSRIVLVYSEGDKGLLRYLVDMGVHHARLTSWGALDIRVIEGSDHTFTPRWATEQLIETICGEMTTWSKRESARR